MWLARRLVVLLVNLLVNLLGDLLVDLLGALPGYRFGGLLVDFSQDESIY